MTANSSALLDHTTILGFPHVCRCNPRDTHSNCDSTKRPCSLLEQEINHSVVIQALVDDKYLFSDIVVGWPGRVHDARVFSNSELYTLGCSGQLFPTDLKEIIVGKQIHPMILGDPAYPHVLFTTFARCKMNPALRNGYSKGLMMTSLPQMDQGLKAKLGQMSGIPLLRIL